MISFIFFLPFSTAAITAEPDNDRVSTLANCRGNLGPSFDTRAVIVSEDEVENYDTTWASAPENILCVKRPCDDVGRVNLSESPVQVWRPTTASDCFECHPDEYVSKRALDVDSGDCVILSCSKAWMIQAEPSSGAPMTDMSHVEKRFSLFDHYISVTEEDECDEWHCGDTTRRACVDQCGHSAFGSKGALIAYWENREDGQCCHCHDECDPDMYESEIYTVEQWQDTEMPCKMRYCDDRGIVSYERMACSATSDDDDTVTEDATGSTTNTDTSTTAASTSGNAGTEPATATPATPSGNDDDSDGSDDDLVLVDGETNLIVLPGDRTLVIVAFRAGDSDADCDLREAEVRALVSNPVTLGRCDGLVDEATGQCDSLTCECRVPEEECRADAAAALQSWSAVESVGLVAETEYRGTAAARWTSPVLTALFATTVGALLR